MNVACTDVAVCGKNSGGSEDLFRPGISVSNVSGGPNFHVGSLSCGIGWEIDKRVVDVRWGRSEVIGSIAPAFVDEDGVGVGVILVECFSGFEFGSDLGMGRAGDGCCKEDSEAGAFGRGFAIHGSGEDLDCGDELGSASLLILSKDSLMSKSKGATKG